MISQTRMPKLHTSDFWVKTLWISDSGAIQRIGNAPYSVQRCQIYHHLTISIPTPLFAPPPLGTIVVNYQLLNALIDCSIQRCQLCWFRNRFELGREFMSVDHRWFMINEGLGRWWRHATLPVAVIGETWFRYFKRSITAGNLVFICWIIYWLNGLRSLFMKRFKWFDRDLSIRRPMQLKRRSFSINRRPRYNQSKMSGFVIIVR